MEVRSLVPRFARLALAAVALAVAAAAPAQAQGRETRPGTYDVSIVYFPGVSIPIPGGLPDCLDSVGTNVFTGTLTVERSGADSATADYVLSFEGTSTEDPNLRLRARATFSSDWTGFTTGMLGGRTDALLSIDAAHLEEAVIQGRVLGQNGEPGHFAIRVGPGGEVLSCRFTGRGAGRGGPPDGNSGRGHTRP